MDRNRAKGKIKEAQGRVMRKVGRLTGSKKTQVKGALRQAEGKLQSTLGRAKDAGRRVRAKSRGEAGTVRTTRVKTVRTTTVRI